MYCEAKTPTYVAMGISIHFGCYNSYFRNGKMRRRWWRNRIKKSSQIWLDFFIISFGYKYENHVCLSLSDQDTHFLY